LRVFVVDIALVIDQTLQVGLRDRGVDDTK
jgi:hypothetical protein